MDGGAMPVTEDYWFARRFPVGHPRNAMAPVSWKGWAVALVFVVAMTIGGLAFALLAVDGRVIAGATIFALSAILGGGWFIAMTVSKGDRTRTVEDYRKDHRA